MIIKDKFPLPKIDTFFDQLNGSHYFSSCDLRQGYWQTVISEEDRDKTAFVTRKGQWRFKVHSFGLCNAPSQFARTMELILAGFTYHTCLIYLDDILVFSWTFGEHCERLGAVLDRLDKHTLKLKPSKCHLFQHKVSFLGHVVSGRGIECDPSKTVAISAWPRPVSISEVRTFCGLASYYRNFVPHFAHIAKPLHDLTKKNATFEWSSDCEISFRELQKRLTSQPILVAPRDDGQYVLDTDASDFALAAVLHQRQDCVLKVIGYVSRSLTAPERRYCITRRELLGVVFGLRKFRQHLLGRRVVVRTDHAALTHLMRTPEPIGQQGRWLDFLAEFELDIVHRAGKKHSNSDALSRRPCQKTDTDDCPQCVRGTTAGTAPQVHQHNAASSTVIMPERQSSSSSPTVAEDVASESEHDGSDPPLPPRQWADEPVIVHEGATNYVPDWANMDNWIPVTSVALRRKGEGRDKLSSRDLGSIQAASVLFTTAYRKHTPFYSH